MRIKKRKFWFEFKVFVWNKSKLRKKNSLYICLFKSAYLSWLLYWQCFDHCAIQPSSGISLYSMTCLEFQVRPFIQSTGHICLLPFSIFKEVLLSVNTPWSYSALCHSNISPTEPQHVIFQEIHGLEQWFSTSLAPINPFLPFDRITFPYSFWRWQARWAKFYNCCPLLSH